MAIKGAGQGMPRLPSFQPKGALGTVMLLLTSLSAHAEWQAYASTEVGGQTYYLNPTTIKPSPIGITVEVLSNYPVPIKESFATFQSIQSAVEMDCVNNQLRDIDMRFHPKPMGQGKVAYQEMGSGEFQSWPPGSVNERLHDILCQ